MKSISKVLIGLVLTFSFFSCEKDDDENNNTNNSKSPALSGSELLISKNWTSVKIFNSGMDVTSQVPSITYDFKTSNTYTSSSSSGSSNGSWSLNGSTLKLDGSDWTVLELNSNSLKIDDQVAVKIYFE